MLTIGWKVMAVSSDGMQLISGADKRLRFPARPGQVVRMPTPGVWMSLSRDHVLDYYAIHDRNALIELTFNSDAVTTGSLADRDTEFCVAQATIRNITVFEEDRPD